MDPLSNIPTRVGRFLMGWGIGGEDMSVALRKGMSGRARGFIPLPVGFLAGVAGPEDGVGTDVGANGMARWRLGALEVFSTGRGDSAVLGGVGRPAGAGDGHFGLMAGQFSSTSPFAV